MTDNTQTSEIITIDGIYCKVKWWRWLNPFKFKRLRKLSKTLQPFSVDWGTGLMGMIL